MSPVGAIFAPFPPKTGTKLLHPRPTPQSLNGSPLDVLVGYLADVLVAAYGQWLERPHQVPVAQLERPVDLVVGCLGVGELLSFPHRANVEVRDRPPECDTSAVSLAQNTQTLCMGMTQPPMPHLSIGDCVYCSFLGAISVRPEVHHEQVEVAALAP